MYSRACEEEFAALGWRRHELKVGRRGVEAVRRLAAYT
jgi:hypothetical protein